MQSRPPGQFRIVRADVLGPCFGVRDALALARGLAAPETVTLHGELVHNPDVQAELRERGFAATPEDRRAGLPATPRVLITPHGVSDAERARLAAAGKELVDATCPLVRRAHEAALRLARAVDLVVVIGRRGHVEVRGLCGDLERALVVESPDEVRRYDAARIGVLCQTTAPARTVREVRAALAAANPQADLRFVDTVCQPTKDRQAALERLLAGVEVVVVVGGRSSNNTRELVATCRARGVPAHRVEGPEELDPRWLEGRARVGLTAGTSTPDERVDAVERALRALAARRAAG